MKRRILALILVMSLVFTLALTGCSQPADEPEEPAEEPGEEEPAEEPEEEPAEEPVEQVLRFNWGSEPPDLDPQTTTDQVSFWIINATMEGLVRLNPDGSVGEGLAEDWEISDDGLEYTFHIRDANWSDGTPVTAEDFAYAWLRVLNPDTAAQYAYQLYHIKNAQAYNTGEITDPSEVGIEVVDEKTLKVTLERETPFFLSLMSFITYVPAQKAAVEQWGEDYALEADQMVYSGPFVIEEWAHEDSLILAKNPEYWDADTVKLERIEGTMITENNTRMQMYDNGELDIATVPAEFLDRYIDDPNYVSQTEATTWYLQFNMEDPWFSNLKLRKAFALATDAQTYVDVVQNGLGQVAEGHTPPAMPGAGGKSFGETRTSELPGYDPEEATRLFEEALDELGVTKEEFEETVTIVAGEGDTWSKIAQFFQSQWKDTLGVELFIEQMTFAMRLDRYNTGTYQITYAGWGGDYNDPLTFMDMWVTDGGNNDAYYSNPDYDAAIQTALTGSGDERYEAMAEAEAIIAEELPIYPMYHPSRNLVVKPHVKGLANYPVGSDYDFKWTYIE
jgi:oligopeptide transport system substrate-binding protein